MQPLQAVQLLDKVTSSFQGTRLDHVQIQNALKVLRELAESKITESIEEDVAEDKPSETTS